jgi:hypothetical protein
MVAGSNIAYWAHLDDQPPIFTWKEFNELIAAWHPNPSAARLAELVEAQTRLVGCSAEAAYRELFETAVMYRGDAINRASEVVMDEQIGVEMDKADSGLALLRIVVRSKALAVSQAFSRGNTSLNFWNSSASGRTFGTTRGM